MNSDRRARQLGHRPRHHRLLDARAAARPSTPATSWARKALAGQHGVGRVAVTAGFHRVELVAAAGLQLDDRDPEPFGQRRVLALGVEHGDEPVRVHGPAPFDQRFDRARLGRPDRAADDHVRVLDQIGVVELERVEEEPVEAGGDVGAEVDPGVTEPAVGVERVHRAQMGHRRAMPIDRDPQPGGRRQQHGRSPPAGRWRRRRAARAAASAARRSARAWSLGRIGRRADGGRRSPAPRSERAAQRQRRHPSSALAGDQRAQLDQRLARRVLHLGAGVVEGRRRSAAVTVTSPA